MELPPFKSKDLESQGNEGSDLVSVPSDVTTFKYVATFSVIGAVIYSLMMGRLAMMRHDLQLFLMAAFAGFLLGESVWIKLRYEYKRQLLNHELILKNKWELILKPLFIPFFIILIPEFSIAINLVAFQEWILRGDPSAWKYPAHLWEWRFWADLAGGFSSALFLWVEIRLLSWTFSYRRTNGVEVSYSIPPRQLQRRLTWSERILLIMSPFPFIIALGYLVLSS